MRQLHELSNSTAQVLKLGDLIRVGRGSEAREDALMGQEMRPGADGEQCALTARVVLLELGIGRDEVERLSLLLDNIVRATADNDEDIEVVETLVGLLPGGLGSNDDALFGQHLGLAGSNGDFEGLGGC